MDADKALTPALCARIINRVQRYNMEHSRLGIPILHGNPATHGHMSVGSTLFPTGLGMGATWNPELVRRVNRVIATESRAQGSYMSDPVIIDVVTDPRWGRTEENWGEDPYLAGRMAEAGVRGLQNDNQFGETAVVSLMKHFLAHGTSVGGLNRAPAACMGRELAERCVEPWKKAVQAGGMALMPSYNEIDGVQNHLNRELLTDVLKRDWGFAGYVIADENAIAQSFTIDHVEESLEQAQKDAFNAGVDVDIACGYEPFGLLEQAAERGEISLARIDDAVRRVLRVKLALGLFEHPYTSETAAECVGCASHRALSLEAARQSAVLLKNDGILPLREPKTIAVIGPNADHLYSQIGDYAAIQKYEHIQTVWKGVRDRAARYGGKALYAKGCGVLRANDEEIAQAVDTARAADVVVAVLGTNSWKEWREGYEHETNCGEGYDVSDLSLPGAQRRLLDALRDTGKPIVCVLVNGRPISEDWNECAAVLDAWYPGCEGGTAVAELLFGDVNPSGKLTLTIPRGAGQLPAYYNRKREMLGGYCDVGAKPLYPFGYGLSYTTYAYSPLTLSAERIAPDGSLTASVDVTNTGARDGEEIVQLYITDEYASVTRPVKALKGFQRVCVPAGQTVRVSFSITADALQLVDREGRLCVEPGDFTVGVGANSERLQLARFRVTAEGRA